MTATTIPLWGIFLTLLVLGIRTEVVRRRREHIPACGDLSTSGWVCNKERGHDGMHMFYDPGTGRGDDKMERWSDDESAFRR